MYKGHKYLFYITRGALWLTIYVMYTYGVGKPLRYYDNVLFIFLSLCCKILGICITNYNQLKIFYYHAENKWELEKLFYD